MKKQEKINQFRENVQKVYAENAFSYYVGFDEILCYEMHSQPVTPRMDINSRGLTFKELAQKWGITVSFWGELIKDHCERLET